MRPLAFLFLVLAPRLFADGGVVQLRQESGPFAVTVFASPVPLQAGTVDISVLVQHRETAQVLLDADVALRFTHGPSVITATATRAQAQNRLLYAGLLNLPESGEWKYSVTVQQGAAHGTVSGSMTTVPAEATLRSHWGSIALAPLCILIFVLHQRLAKRGGRRAEKLNPGPDVG